MKSVQLIHWNEGEAKNRAALLSRCGYEVAYEVPPGPKFLKRLRNEAPAAVVIDLGRLPAHGRDIGIALRCSKATRHVPLVFVDGDPRKVEGVRGHLPDAVYTQWSGIRTALRRAIANPPADPVVPKSQLQAYAGRPLAKKLGIGDSTVVGLVRAPKGFVGSLGRLPAGAVVRKQARGRLDLIIWFVRSPGELRGGMRRMADRVGDARIWIAWPKKSSGRDPGLSQQDVRRAGLDAGLVDYKICSIDSTWSGLLFTHRS